MPHAELHYTADLDLDARAILEEVETIFNAHDPEAGACKGRAYRIAEFHHTHVLLRLSALSKPLRDGPFTMRLLDDIEQALKARIGDTCYVTIDLSYSGPLYRTGRHDPATTST